MSKLVCMRACAFDSNDVGVKDAVAFCGECAAPLVSAELDSPLMSLIVLKRQVRDDLNHSGLNDLERAWSVLKATSPVELFERFRITPAELTTLVRQAFATFGVPEQ